LKIGLLGALLLAAITALVIFPLLMLYGLLHGSVFLFFGSLIEGVIIVGFLTVIIAGVVMYYIWRAIPRTVQLGIVAILFVVGILFVQPELDILAIIGLVFTALGIGQQKALKR